jgi:hypothetical protein
MVFSGLLAGITLELLLPNEDNVSTERRLIRSNIIFGGICIATWLSYFQQD